MGTSISEEYMADDKQIQGAAANASPETSAQANQAAAQAAVSTQASESAQPTAYTFGGKTYNSVDDLGKAYEKLQSEHGKWTQQYGDLRKQYDTVADQAKKWNDWWSGIQPLWGPDVERLLEQKLSGAHGPAAQRQAQQQVSAMAQQAGVPDPFEGYELLSPREQFSRFRDLAYQEMGGAVQQQMAALANAVQQTLAQKEQWYQTYLNNHLSLLRKALEHKQLDPNFDIDKTMELAAQAIGGQIDPIQLGQQLISAASLQSEMEKAKKAAYEAGKTDAMQEAENKAKEAVPTFGSPPQIYKVPDTPNTNGRNSITRWRQNAYDNLTRKFGPTWAR